MNVKQKLESYPDNVMSHINDLRALIFEVAKQHHLGEVQETLKWGEPSYLVKGGSPVRIDWKKKFPDQYFIFFNCNTKLVDTFRELYSDWLEFQGNRAIVLTLNDEIPKQAICHCLELAMKYQSLKHKPLLGA